mgnify:CR=1 FL=1
MWNESCEIGVLVGKTLKSIQNNGDELLFEADDGEKFKMYHSQDCCESVTLEDVCGDFDDLIGTPILVAESVEGETAQPEGWEADEYEESYTWTFYKIDTAKGGVTLRWFGSSNGYYSESVDFERVRVTA